MPRAKSPSKKASTTNGDARSNGSSSEVKKQTSAVQTSSAVESHSGNGAVPKARATETSVNPSVSQDQIRQRAYELYTQRGSSHGHHVEDWFRAEAELLGRR